MNDMKEISENPKIKLLLVEDDKVTVDVVKRILKYKYDINSVTNGEDALKKAADNDYAAFLIDIGLSGKMDGIQTTKKLKEIKNNKGKAYIALTAYAMKGDEEYFLSKGLTHYISKPFEFKELKELIERVLVK